MRTRYPAELKEAALRDLLSETLTLREASEKYSVNTSTLKYWIKSTSKRTGAGGGVSDDANKHIARPERPPLPRGVTVKQAYAAVVLREHMGADSESFGAYCRASGIQAAAVAVLAGWFERNELTDMGSQAYAEAMCRSRESKIRQLQYELERKEKALAETAALLVLSKKAEAVWGSRGS